MYLELLDNANLGRWRHDPKSVLEYIDKTSMCFDTDFSGWQEIIYSERHLTTAYSIRNLRAKQAYCCREIAAHINSVDVFRLQHLYLCGAYSAETIIGFKGIDGLPKDERSKESIIIDGIARRLYGERINPIKEWEVLLSREK